VTEEGDRRGSATGEQRRAEVECIATKIYTMLSQDSLLP